MTSNQRNVYTDIILIRNGSAINRFRTVVDNYETTIYTEEALHRLLEIYFIIGLKEESKK